MEYVEVTTDRQWGEYISGPWEKTEVQRIRALKNINFNNAMIAEAAALVDYDELSYDNAAQEWLSTYESKWQNWIPQECRKHRPVL